MDGTLATTEQAKKPGRRLVGQAITTNPLIAAVAFVDEAHVDDLDEEISTTENYLAGLKAMRNLAGQAIGKPVTQPVQQTPAPKPKPKPKPPEDDEDDEDEKEDEDIRLHADDYELEDINAADENKEVGEREPWVKQKRYLPPKNSPERPAADDALRRKICRYIKPFGKVRRADLIKKCDLAAKISTEFLRHPWFQILECGSYSLTRQGEEEGLATEDGDE